VAKYVSSLLPQFFDGYRSLPKHIQELARAAYKRFAIDPAHPGLHFEPVKSAPGHYSARINRGYRVLGYMIDGVNIGWYWAGSHKEFDQKFPTNRKKK
jgi:hypothetical protein